MEETKNNWKEIFDDFSNVNSVGVLLVGVIGLLIIGAIIIQNTNLVNFGQRFVPTTKSEKTKSDILQELSASSGGNRISDEEKLRVLEQMSQNTNNTITYEEKVKVQSRELEAEQIRSHSILENTGEGVILTDSRSNMTYVNPSFTKLTGFMEEEMVGKEFSDVIKAFDLKRKEIIAAEVSDAAAVTAKKKEMKVFIKSKNGDLIGVVINAAPVYADEEFIGVVRVVHEVTEEIALQQQKDDFFSIASHELRTPLSVIAGNLDTVLAGYGKSDIGQEDMALLEDSMVAADRLSKMVTDFLNVSRLDQGRLKYEVKPLDSCFVTESVTREMRTLAEKKNIALNFVCDSTEEHKMVMADEGLLKEALINLIGNSLKFTEQGEIKITHGMKDGMSYTQIADNGIGIAKDKQGLLFQRFQQAMNKTISRQAGGTGLGLYISREFIRMMGGDLVLESSEMGVGSTFSFTLPLVQSNNK